MDPALKTTLITAASTIIIGFLTWLVQEHLKQKVERERVRAEEDLEEVKAVLKTATDELNSIKASKTLRENEKQELEVRVKNIQSDAEQKARELKEISERTTSTRAELQKVLAEKEYFIKGLRSPVIVPKGDRRNSIMLLGLGGVGKTTLISKLFQIDNPNPSEKTERYEIYFNKIAGGINEQNGNNLHTWFYISDYVGQNLGTLVRAFVEQQFTSYSPMAYGHITSMVLVLDLFAPPPQKDQKLRPKDQFDGDRIAFQLEQWQKLVFEAVFGLMTDSLKYVCVFINKIDLLKNRTPASDVAARKAFADIQTRLQSWCNNTTGVELQVIVGSVETTEGIGELARKLRQYSVIDNP